MSPKCCHLAPMGPLAPPHHHKARPGSHHPLIYEHIGPCNCSTTVCILICSRGLYKQSIDGTMKYGNAHLNRLWRVCNLIDKSSSFVRFFVHWISDDCCQNSGRKSAIQAHRERAGAETREVGGRELSVILSRSEIVGVLYMMLKIHLTLSPVQSLHGPLTVRLCELQ